MSSKYHGVSLHQRSGKYQAKIIIDGEWIHIGTFDDEREAAKQVDLTLISRWKDPVNVLKPLKK